MIFTEKKYPCKIIIKSIVNGKQILATKQIQSMVFEIKNNIVKCFSTNIKYGYGWKHIHYILLNNKWVHPLRFMEYIQQKGDKNVFTKNK